MDVSASANIIQLPLIFAAEPFSNTEWGNYEWTLPTSKKHAL